MLTAPFIEESWWEDADAYQGCVLPPSFWESRSVLRFIRDSALSRRVSPDAVLAHVFGRVLLHTPVTLTIPALIGGEASLNFSYAVVGNASAGKGAARAVADALVPISKEIPEAGLASGPGMVAAYFAKIGSPAAWSQVRQAMYFTSEEGKDVDRDIFSTLNKMWAGESVGGVLSQRGDMTLRSHNYRAVVGLSIQPAFVGKYVGDVTSGTPQRFVWAMASHPALGHPETLPPVPAADTLGWTAPPPNARWDPHTHPLEFPEQVRVFVQSESAAAHQVDPWSVQAATDLDGRKTLLALKVAAALALLERRYDVSMQDWILAREVLEVSVAVRDRSMILAAEIEERGKK